MPFGCFSLTNGSVRSFLSNPAFPAKWKKKNLISPKAQPVATFFAGHEAAVINEELRFGKFRLEIRGGEISTRRVVQCWNGAWRARGRFSRVGKVDVWLTWTSVGGRLWVGCWARDLGGFLWMMVHGHFFFHIYRKLVVLHEVGMRLEIIPLKE